MISGGAEGIDAAAHRGALDVGGPTVVVLAGGLGRPFPRAHAPLFREIAERGAVLSEAADDHDPRPFEFLARNRLIAALARAVVVVQAPARSGALSTAAHARRLGRPVLAVPWSLRDPRGEGCVALLASGARVCRNAHDVLAAIGIVSQRESRSNPRCRSPVLRAALEPDERAVLEVIRARPAQVDEIVRALELDVSRVQVALTGLLVRGLAAPDDRFAYRALWPER